MTGTHVPVLIVGGGTVGLSAALFLAHHGIDTLLVERQDGPSIHPRATGVGPRTVEFFREVGIDDAVNAAAIDMTAGGPGRLAAETLAQADLANAAGPRTGPDLSAVSPSRLRGMCPQDRLDSVLLTELSKRGADVRYSTRLVTLEQDDGGVTATLDGPVGRWVVRASYLLAADGLRSDVRETLGIGMSGPEELGQPLLNILFRADLSAYTQGASFIGCGITTPDAPGMLMTVDGVENWIFHTGYNPDAGETTADFTAERCRELIRSAIGDAELEVEIRSALPWRPRGLLANRFTDGRVFLAGDAAHVVPPIGAFGLNTGVADAHNLAWKLATVLRAAAGPALLGSYQAERLPVAALTLEQAMLRFDDPLLHWGADARTRAAAGVMHGPVVHLGYRYDSDAVLGPAPDLPSWQDVELTLDGTPGSRLPHAWLHRDGQQVSTLDLVKSRFSLLTPSDDWIRAAQTASRSLGFDLAAHQIAPHARITDPQGRWPGVAGLNDDGALLVRPDGIIAWRAPTMTEHPTTDLTQALTQVLARSQLPEPQHSIRCGTAKLAEHSNENNFGACPCDD